MNPYYSADQLSNEEYHANTTHFSGSFLHKLYSQCPAKARYEPRKDASHFIFGTTAHTNILEQARFDAEYFRQPDPSEFKDLITSDAGMKSFLKAEGVPGYSSKKTDELIAMIRATGKPAHIWADILAKTEKAAGKRIIVPGKDYDAVMKMRQVIMTNGEMREIVESGEPEVSLFTVIDGVPVKCRIDRITGAPSIIDYKSTRDASPEGFGRLAYNLGYYFKMALQHDIFCKVMGRKPESVELLAQEKEDPYLAKCYQMTDWQLEVGRNQYRAALAITKQCIEFDSWPNYGLSNGKQELYTPDFVKARHK